jgi:hypothetical protein
MSCGAARETTVARSEPQPLPAHVESVDASAPAPTLTACLELRAASAADFGAARELYNAKKWAEAAAMFRSIAFEASSDRTGIYATELYLDALNQLLREGHKVCVDDMERDVPKLRDVYCGSQRTKNEDDCKLLDRIQMDLGRVRAEALDANDDHAGAAARYLELLKAWCMPATESRCDEIAFNAAVSFLAAGDEAAAKRVRAIMGDPKNRMDKSVLVEKLDCRIDPTSRPKCH